VAVTATASVAAARVNANVFNDMRRIQTPPDEKRTGTIRSIYDVRSGGVSIRCSLLASCCCLVEGRRQPIRQFSNRQPREASREAERQ